MIEQEQRLTKSKLNDIISLFNKAKALSKYTLWDRDIIYPITVVQYNNDDNFNWSFQSDSLNGVHILENRLLGFTGTFLFDSTNDSLDQLKEKIKETGLTNIKLIYTETMIGVYVDGGYYELLTKINNVPDFDRDTMMYESFDARINYLKSVSDTPCKLINSGEIAFILMGSVVKLVGNNGVVRISKNMFPLLGPVRSTAEDPFRVEYVLVPTSSGPAVILFTDYKKFRAIHIYNYIEY